MLHKDRATTKIIGHREFLLLLQIPHVEAYTMSSLQINNFAFLQVVVNVLTAVYVLGREKRRHVESKGTLDFFVAIIKATH